MIKITDALVTEHIVLLTVFDQIERMLPETTTKNEVARLASLIKALLIKHSDTEDNLVFITLDHTLEQTGQLRQLHQEHQEIDLRYEKVFTAESLSVARELLKQALQATRIHFRNEEKHVFPFVEKMLQKETLTELGDAWAKQKAS